MCRGCHKFETSFEPVARSALLWRLACAGAAALALQGTATADVPGAAPEPQATSPTPQATSPTPQATSPTPQATAPAGPPFAIYGQATYVEQETDGFRSPYSGPNSLSPDEGRESTDATLFLGARLWQGAELWLNPETDEGFGLDDTLGLAGFSSGEAYKIGSDPPYFRLQRAFVRQTFNLGADRTAVDAGPNQFAGAVSSNRIVVTLGKFSVVDVFDTNRYAHDASQDFLNWSVIDAGTFDYAADSWGYTVGAAGEWYTGPWAFRAGLFDLSNVPNSTTLEPCCDEFQVDLEMEHRHELFGRPGKLALTAFESHARMALLQDAIEYGIENGVPPDPAAVRQYRKRDGISLDVEQQITGDLGVFARAGDAGGNVETYEFTDIDRTLSLGMSLQGNLWHRPDDTVGLAGVVNAISKERQLYLADGGLGILVGDGQLPHPGNENIIETYYSWVIISALHVTLDYQWVGNPAYNGDRGPVSIVAVRVHVQL
jgi:high affinity Mn2+ porin